MRDKRFKVTRWSSLDSGNMNNITHTDQKLLTRVAFADGQTNRQKEMAILVCPNLSTGMESGEGVYEGH